MSARNSLLVVLTGVAIAFGPPARSCAAGPPAKERLDLYGDTLPAGAIMRLGTQRWRHRHGFIDPVFSPDGRWLVSRSLLDRTSLSGLNVWDWSSGRIVRTLDHDTFDPWPFRLYAFLPDGKRLLSHGNGELSMWEFPSFRLLKRWRVGPWRSLVLSPDGRIAAGRAGDEINPREVHAFNLQTGSGRAIWKTDSGYVAAVALTRDGCIVVVHASSVRPPGDESDTTFSIIRIDLLTRRVCSRFAVQADKTVLAPDGRNLVASSWGRGLRLYRVDTGKMRRLPLTAGIGMAYDVMFRSDGRVLVTVESPRIGPKSWEEWVHSGPPLAWTWDVDRGELVDRIRVPDWGWDNWPTLTPDGRALLLSNSDAVTRVRLRTGKRMDHWPAFNHPINDLRWSTDGREVVAETWSEHQVKWNAVTGGLLGRKQLWDFPIFYSPWAHSLNGGWLAMLTESNDIELFDLPAGKVKHKLIGHGQEVSALQFSLDGRLLASADIGGTVHLWDVNRGKALLLVDSPSKTKYLQGVFFSPDARHLAAAAQDGLVHVWEVRTGKYVRGLSLPEATQEEVMSSSRLAGTFIPSENLFLFAHAGRLVAWDLLTGREDKRFQKVEDHPPLPSRRGPCLAPSSDGRFLFRVDGGAWLYETASGRIIHTLAGSFSTADFHPSLRRVAIGDDRRICVLIYDLPTLFRCLPARSHQPTLQQLWDDLADRDASRAYGAVGRLTVAPGMAALLASKLTPIARPKPGSLEKHITNLASGDFETRQKSEEALREAADTARTALQLALGTATDLEQRLRLRRILNRLDRPSQEMLRQYRAILALEVRGTLQARQLLRKLATGAPDARLTLEAKAALARLASRP